jgi:hypothetical protein
MHFNINTIKLNNIYMQKSNMLCPKFDAQIMN